MALSSWNRLWLSRLPREQALLLFTVASALPTFRTNVARAFYVNWELAWGMMEAVRWLLHSVGIMGRVGLLVREDVLWLPMWSVVMARLIVHHAGLALVRAWELVILLIS